MGSKKRARKILSARKAYRKAGVIFAAQTALIVGMMKSMHEAEKIQRKFKIGGIPCTSDLANERKELVSGLKKQFFEAAENQVKINTDIGNLKIRMGECVKSVDNGEKILTMKDLKKLTEEIR
jgi:hypothetical protein